MSYGLADSLARVAGSYGNGLELNLVASLEADLDWHDLG